MQRYHSHHESYSSEVYWEGVEIEKWRNTSNSVFGVFFFQQTTFRTFLIWKLLQNILKSHVIIHVLNRSHSLPHIYIAHLSVWGTKWNEVSISGIDIFHNDNIKRTIYAHSSSTVGVKINCFINFTTILFGKSRNIQNTISQNLISYLWAISIIITLLFW